MSEQPVTHPDFPFVELRQYVRTTSKMLIQAEQDESIRHLRAVADLKQLQNRVNEARAIVERADREQT